MWVNEKTGTRNFRYKQTPLDIFQNLQESGFSKQILMAASALFSMAASALF